MINCFIGTFNREGLSIGAAKSIRKNIDNVCITLINAGTKKIQNNIFDKVINIEFGRWFGFKIAHQLCDENRINLYIDDDIRLLSNVILQERYPFDKNNYYMPNNGYMVQIWKKIYKSPNNTNKIDVKRIYSKKSVLIDDDHLKNLMIQNRCQIIDKIWLHIDKGSEKITPARKLLIDYIDGINYGGDGDGSGDSQLVNS